MIDYRTDMNVYLVDTVKCTVAFMVVLLVISSVEQASKQLGGIAPKSFLSQSGKWYRISTQDKDPVYALQHCDYAIAYLNAARHGASDHVLEKGSGIDLHKYHNKLASHQMAIMKQLPKMKGRSRSNTSQASWLT